MTKCPSCFQELPERRFQWICNSGICPSSPDPEASRFVGTQVSLPPVTSELTHDAAGFSPPNLSCGTCRGEAIPCCPHCHFGLPPNWYGSDAMCVALAGARYTGKSVYIGVVVHFLQELVHEHLGGAMLLATPQTQEVYNSVYRRVLFEEMGAMGATPSTATSQTYQVWPMIISLGPIQGKTRYLVIRDVAGEDLEGHNRGALSFFKHADLVTFLFDPLAVPAIQHHLKGVIPAQEQGSQANPIDVLATVQQLIGGQDARLAVVLSKFDALQELRRFPESDLGKVMSNLGAAVMRHPEKPGDPNDLWLVHNEVRGILQMLGAGNIVASMEKPARGKAFQHRFLAVSSLGASADGRRLAETGIAPYRCLDPLLWLFGDRGLIPR